MPRVTLLNAPSRFRAALGYLRVECTNRFGLLTPLPVSTALRRMVPNALAMPTA
jgi:hypothetical protein